MTDDQVTVEILDEGGFVGWKEWLEKAVRCAAGCVLKNKSKGHEVAVLVTDEDEMRRINGRQRGLDRVTDVLSFPSGEDVFLGDIVIARERVMAQAEEYGHSVERELSFLAVHGVLHLLGFDHMEDTDREKMEKMQRIVMDKLGVSR